MAIGDPPNLNPFAGLVNVSDMWAHLNSVNAEKELMAQHQQLQAMQAGAWSPSIEPPKSPATRTQMASRAREMFLKRMGGIRAELKIAESDFLQCHVDGDIVYLFYCFSGRDGCVKENIDMFPSDQLITQFRMVLAAT